MPVRFTHTRSITAKEIRNPRVLELFGLWSSHRQGAAPPRAAALLPEARALCDADLMLLERAGARDYRYLHYGANIAEHAGSNRKGALVSAIGGELGAFYAKWYGRTIAGGEALYTIHRTDEGAHAKSWERLILPLDDEGAAQVLVFCTPMLLRMELMSGVIETSHCGVMALEAVRNAKGHIIDFMTILANPLAAEILRQDRAQLIDQRLSKVFPESRDAGLFHSFVAIADGSPPMDVTFQMGERWLRITAARTGTGVTLTMSDVTVFKRQNAELEREIALRNEAEFELVRLATTDALTGLPNRRHFLDRAERELQRATRAGSAASLLYLDIDHFKSVNDTYGHAAGDAVLKAVAETLAGGVRPYDLAGRLGGEEFAVILPNAAASDALVVAERIRQQVGALQTDVGAPEPLSVTISCGAANAREGETLEALIARADAALYEAKRGGRNQVREAA